MRRIFLVSPAEQWLATLVLRRLDRFASRFVPLLPKEWASQFAQMRRSKPQRREKQPATRESVGLSFEHQ